MRCCLGLKLVIIFLSVQVLDFRDKIGLDYLGISVICRVVALPTLPSWYSLLVILLLHLSKLLMNGLGSCTCRCRGRILISSIDCIGGDWSLLRLVLMNGCGGGYLDLGRSGQVCEEGSVYLLDLEAGLFKLMRAWDLTGTERVWMRWLLIRHPVIWVVRFWHALLFLLSFN